MCRQASFAACWTSPFSVRGRSSSFQWCRPRPPPPPCPRASPAHWSPRATQCPPRASGRAPGRDLIVLPTQAPVEDRHLALVSHSPPNAPRTLSSYIAFMPSLTSIKSSPPDVASLVVEYSHRCQPLRETDVPEFLRIAFLPRARSWPHALQPTAEPPTLPLLAPRPAATRMPTRDPWP